MLVGEVKTGHVCFPPQRGPIFNTAHASNTSDGFEESCVYYVGLWNKKYKLSHPGKICNEIYSQNKEAVHNVTLGENFNQWIGKAGCGSFQTCLSFLNLNTTHWVLGEHLGDTVLFRVCQKAPQASWEGSALLTVSTSANEGRQQKENTVTLEQSHADLRDEKAFQPLLLPAGEDVV